MTWFMRQKMLKPFLFILILIIFFISKNQFLKGDTNEYKYVHYDDIPDNSGIKTWLPNDFPNASRNIYFFSNLDLNYFSIKFSLDANHSASYIRTLTKKASKNGIYKLKKEDKDIGQAWCLNQEKSGNNVLYLVGKYTEKNTFYIIKAISDYTYEPSYNEKIKYAEKTLCI
ncbi:hypothetical protein FPE49_003312 [Salmonella bongori]|nr:hypothetical protein [Salmonella bongori]EDP8625051.1 hypothetical protein [Salmonella bongori]